MECGTCNLIRRKPKCQVVEDGIEKKLCPHCGKVLPLHRFYDRTVHRGAREYRFKTSWCKMCMSAKASQRGKRIF